MTNQLDEALATWAQDHAARGGRADLGNPLWRRQPKSALRLAAERAISRLDRVKKRRRKGALILWREPRRSGGVSANDFQRGLWGMSWLMRQLLAPDKVRRHFAPRR